MRFSSGVFLTSACGLQLFGCWGSDQKLGEVLKEDAPVQVDPVEFLEPTTFGLPACQTPYEIRMLASFDRTFDCAGTPCALERNALINGVSLTSDGANVTVFLSLNGAIRYGRLRAGGLDTLKALRGQSVFADRDVVVTVEYVYEGDDPNPVGVSRVHRVVAGEPQLLTTISGYVRRVTATPDGFAVQGWNEILEADEWRELTWVSRHDAAGTELWRQEFPKWPELPPDREIALGEHGELFEYRITMPKPSELARYDAAGTKVELTTLPPSYRQSIAAGANDQLIVAAAQGTESTPDRLGVLSLSREGDVRWSFEGPQPEGRRMLRALVAADGDAYVAAPLWVPGTGNRALGVLRFSSTGDACVAGSWTFDGDVEPAGLVETADGVVVATQRLLGIVPKR